MSRKLHQINEGISGQIRDQVFPRANPDALWEWDIETDQVWWNGEFQTLFGYDNHQLKPGTQAWHELVHPQDIDRVSRSLDEAVDQGNDEWEEQYRFRRADGTYAYVLDRGFLIKKDQKPVRMVGSITDITREKRKEAALENAERRFQAGFDYAQLGIVIADMDGNLILVNEAFETMLGYSQHELIRGSYRNITHPDDIEKSFQEVRSMHSGQATSFRLEKRYIHKQGRVVWAVLHSTLIFDADGNKDCIFSIIQDITNEKKLREEQQKLLALIENSVELMALLELDGHTLYLNRTGRKMLGFGDMHQVQDTHLSKIYNPDNFRRIEKEILPSILETGKWSGLMQVRNLKTKEEFPVHTNSIRIDDPTNGMPIAVGAVMRDLRPELVAQNALIKSEERFRNLVMQAPVAIALLRGEDLVVELANDAVLNLWGKSTDIIGLPCLQALPEIEGQGFIEKLLDVYQTGMPHYGYEVLARLIRNNRLEDAYFNFVYSPVREVDDSISGVMVIASEVSQQVKVKKELEESEARFRNLILDAPVATAIYYGEDMIIHLANDEMISLWGKDSSVIGKNLREALPELEGQPFLKLLRRVYDTGVAYHATEDRADLVVDGILQTYYFNFTYKPLHDSDGKVYAILNMAVDVTHRVRAMHKLTEAEESLREAIELAELGTWTIYPLLGRVECSPRVKEWIGVTADTVTMEDIAQSTHEKDRARTNEISSREFSPGGSGKIDLEYTVVNKLTGQERILHTQARAYFNEEGEIYRIQGTSVDITTLRLTQQELENQVKQRTEQLQKSNAYLMQSNQELEQYAYVASHDLQEPLRKIQIFSGMLENNQDLNDHSREILSKIIRSSERMSLLIKDLLEYSRLLNSKVRVVSVNLQNVLEKVIVDFELVIEEKKATVSFDALPVIEGVPLQMNQLFYNLMSNALKFAREDVPPDVQIRARKMTKAEVENLHLSHSFLTYYDIAFIDNGIGFSPEYADRIFEMFRRLHTRSIYPGSGIGLALCKRIVLNHQGLLFSESKENQGAEFHIILPEKQIDETFNTTG